MHNPNEVLPLQPSDTADSIYSVPRDAASAEGVVDRPRGVDPNNPPWGLLGAVLIWVASIFVQAIPLVFLVPYALYKGLGPTSPELLFLQILSVFPTQVLLIVLLWAFVSRMGKLPFLQSLGWGWSPRVGLWLSIAIGLVLFAIATALAKLVGADKTTGLEELINSSLAARYLIAALAVFTAPFTEEFVYRGVIYSAVQRAIGVKGAVVFVSTLFTLVHVPQYWPNAGVISAVALLSIVLTVIRADTGRILPCVVIHLAFNGIQAVILIVEPYARNFLPRTEPAVPTISILPTLIRLVF